MAVSREAEDVLGVERVLRGLPHNEETPRSALGDGDPASSGTEEGDASLEPSDTEASRREDPSSEQKGLTASLG